MVLLIAFMLAACSGGNEPPAATLTPATDTVATSAAEATAPATTAPTAEVAASATPATADPTTEPTAAPTAAPTVLCPDVPRPALLLSTGTSLELHDPLGGARCPVPLAEDLGPEFIAGQRIYFIQRDLDTATATVSRVGPDRTVEPLAATQSSGDTYYLLQFAVAPDESRLAWSHSRPAGGDDPMALISSLWLAAADGSDATPVFEDAAMPQSRLAAPVRFSADGQTLFFTWQPNGLGGMWNAFSGRYDNLYRVPAAGGEAVKVFDCADRQLFLCLGDFRDDGTLAYIDTERTIHVSGPDGAELVAIPTTAEYAGYPTFHPNGDLFYSTAMLPEGTSDFPFPSPGTVHHLAAPYSGAPAVVASAFGLLTEAMPQPFLDATHLVVNYAEEQNWGRAVLDVTTGAITRIEPWPNAYLSAVWPAE